MRPMLSIGLMIAFILSSCATQTQSSLPTAPIIDTPVELQVQTDTIVPTIDATATPEITPTEVPVILTEAIQINSPKQAESISNPVSITGIADTTGDQTVYVRLIDLDSIELGSTNIIIQNPTPPLSAFEVMLEYTPGEAEDAILQVYTMDSSSGTVKHLNSRTGKLVPTDPPKKSVMSTTESMQIDSARIIQNNNKLELHAEGSAGNLFENGLNYSLCGIGGTGSPDLICGTVDNIMLKGMTTIQTAEVGGTGKFELRIPLQNGQWKKAHLVIYSLSAANGEVTHAASISIKNGP